jgi:hypothetical protein
MKKNASLIRAATGLISNRPSMPSFRDTRSSIKDLTKKRSDMGKKLLTLGAALLIMPDPITDAAAIPVLIAGKVLQSRQASNVKNVYDEMRQSLSSLSSSGL